MRAQERYRQVARLHICCLDQGFLSTLGERFLTLMYEAIDHTNEAVLLVAEQDDQVQGFITGGVGMGPIYHRMLRSPVRLAMAMAPVLLRPSKVRRILEIVRYAGSGGFPAGVPDAELLSLAVASEWRGQSVAERLYARLVEDFSRRGVSAFRITVGEALEPAHRFYRRMGAIEAGKVEVHGGEVSRVYVHCI